MHATGNIVYWVGLAGLLASIAPMFSKRHDPIDTIRRGLGRMTLSTLVIALGAILMHRYFALAINLVLAVVFYGAWLHYRRLQRERD